MRRIDRAGPVALGIGALVSAGLGCADVLGLGSLHPRPGTTELYHYSGRWDTTTPATSSSQNAMAEWPGSAVTATFRGTGVSASLTDTANTGGDFDAIAVEIDGVYTTTLPLDGATCEASPCTLASGLSPGSHTVAIYKATDSTFGGRITFRAFDVAGGDLTPEVYTFTRQIEFIGDDITAGRLVLETQVTSCKTLPTDKSSEYDGYAGLVARHVGAERSNLSIPGTGLTVTYDQAPTIAEVYSNTLPDEAGSPWSHDPLHAAWNPDLVVVDLGGYGDFASTTDSFTPLTSADRTFERSFEAAYASFLASVRAAHPSAFILVVAGNGYAGAISAKAAAGIVEHVVESLKSAGQETGKTMGFLSAPVQSSYACALYPNESDQEDLANAVIDQIHASPLAW